jgi:D-alanyl-lipoteichoic acid acyltransferase DltB (MBOAT superfamily)
MLVVGLWHGANWTFALFGLFHGLLFIPLILSGSFASRKKLKVNSLGLPKFRDLMKIIGTFLLVTFGLIIFRADSIGQFVDYLSGFINFLNLSQKTISGIYSLIPIFILTALMFIVEWIYRADEYALVNMSKNWKYPLKWGLIYGIIFTIIILGKFNQSSFIYFQF